MFNWMFLNVVLNFLIHSMPSIGARPVLPVIWFVSASLVCFYHILLLPVSILWSSLLFCLSTFLFLTFWVSFLFFFISSNGIAWLTRWSSVDGDFPNFFYVCLETNVPFFYISGFFLVVYASIRFFLKPVSVFCSLSVFYPVHVFSVSWSSTEFLVVFFSSSLVALCFFSATL